MAWASGPAMCPCEDCGVVVSPAQPRCPNDVANACCTLKEHIYHAHPDATDGDYAAAGFARCPVPSCACLLCVAEEPGRGARPQWRSNASTHASRRDGQVNGGESMPAGHHARVAAMGGNTALAKRYVNSVAAGACVGSLGESILVLNGAPGGYIQKAAKDRRMHGAAGLLPSSSPARATLPAPRAGGADSDGGEDDGDDSDPDAIGRTVPPADMDVSWIDGVPINQIRGIRAKMQELPSRPVLRNHLLQPCVFAFNMVGANATDNSTAKAAIGYKMYAMCHIVIFGRPRGATRISKPELRRRAATIAARVAAAHVG